MCTLGPLTWIYGVKVKRARAVHRD